MKYRKIFTFILLLCTIFGTLLFINPNVKAESEGTLISLEGATITWKNEPFYLSTNVSFDVSFDAVDSFSTPPRSYSFDTLTFGSNGRFTIYVPDRTGYSFYYYDYEDNTFGFSSSLPTTWVITGGNDITNSVLCNFIQEHCTIEGGIWEEEPPLVPTYTISGQYQFNDEITWLYDTSEQEGILYLPFYVYNLDNPTRVNYDYMLNQNREDLGINYFLYANETDSGTFIGQYAGRFTTSTTINMFNDRIVYFYTAEVSEGVYNWLNENGQFINDPTLDPNNPDNPDSGNNPNNPNNPDFGTDTVRQIVNQVNAFLGIQILPGLSFRDILLICIALPLLMYILKVFLGG